MFPKLVAYLKMRIKKTAKAIKAGIISVTCPRVTPSISACFPFSGYIVPTGAVQALNLGLRYRITNSHAPVFSLFTFFGNRQTPVSGI